MSEEEMIQAQLDMCGYCHNCGQCHDYSEEECWKMEAESRNAIYDWQTDETIRCLFHGEDADCDCGK